MEQDLANRWVVPALQCFYLPETAECLMQCVRAHYRDEATMCCFPTNLAFFPLLSKANVTEFLCKHADSQSDPAAKFIMYHASGIKKCFISASGRPSTPGIILNILTSFFEYFVPEKNC